jgi:hypothetical protein
MPTLTIGTRTYRASNAGVVGEADQMFKLSPERRVHRLAHAKSALARASGAKGSTEDLPVTKAAIRKGSLKAERYSFSLQCNLRPVKAGYCGKT